MSGERWLAVAEAELLDAVISRRAPLLQSAIEQLVQHRRLDREVAMQVRATIGEELASTGVDPSTGARYDRGKFLDEVIDREGSLSELWD